MLNDLIFYFINKLFFDFRWRFNTLVRKPYSLAPFYQMGGWGFKGIVAYLAYYWLICSKLLI